MDQTSRLETGVSDSPIKFTPTTEALISQFKAWLPGCPTLVQRCERGELTYEPSDHQNSLRISIKDLNFLLDQLEQAYQQQDQRPDWVRPSNMHLQQWIHYTQGWIEPLLAGLAGAYSNQTQTTVSEQFLSDACQRAAGLIGPKLSRADTQFLAEILEFWRITPRVLSLFESAHAKLDHCYCWAAKHLFNIVSLSELHFEPASALIYDALAQVTKDKHHTTSFDASAIEDRDLVSIYADYVNQGAYRACLHCLVYTQKPEPFIDCLLLNPWGFFRTLQPSDYRQVLSIIARHRSHQATDKPTTERITHLLTESLIAQDLFLTRPNPLSLKRLHADNAATEASNENTDQDIRLQLKQSLFQFNPEQSSRARGFGKTPYQKLLHLESQLTQHHRLHENPLLESALGKAFMDAGILVKGIEHLEHANINALGLGLTDLIITNQIYLSLCHFWCANQSHLYKMCYTNTHHFSPYADSYMTTEYQSTAPTLPLNLWSEFSVFNYRIEQGRTQGLNHTAELMIECLDYPILGTLKFFLLINLANWHLHQTQENNHAQAMTRLEAAKQHLEQNAHLNLTPLWAVFIFTSGIAHLCGSPSTDQTKKWLSNTKPLMKTLFNHGQFSEEAPNLWQCIAETIFHFISAQSKSISDASKRLQDISDYAEKSNYRVVSLYAHLFSSILHWTPNTQAQAKSRFAKAVNLAEQLNLNGIFVLLAKQAMPLIKQAEQANQSRHFLNQISEQLNENNNRVSHHLDKLSQRELEILSLIAQGMTNEEIANHLDRSKGTVKLHVHNIYKKLGTKNRIEAIQNYTHWQKIHNNLTATT